MMKAWWFGALAVLVVPVAALATAAVLVDPDDYKPRLIDAVQDATGRTLSLDGPLRITWSLWPTLQVNGARLANLPGGSRPDMARAERIEAQISLPALLQRRIEVTQLRLVGPNVLFEVVDGTPNWAFTAPPTPDAPARPSTSSFHLHVDAAHVQNGMVTWHLPAGTRVVGLRSFDLHHPQDDVLKVDGTLVYGDNQPFALRASARATAGLRDPWRTEIDFAAYDTTAHAQGTMSLAGNYDLDVDGRSGTLDKLNALLPEMGLPPVRGLAVRGHVANNPVLGSLPVFGPLHLGFDAADIRQVVPGLQLGRTEVSLPAAGGAATLASKGKYRGQDVTLAGTVGVPRRPEERNAVPIKLTTKAEGGSVALAGTLRVDRLRFVGLDVAASLDAPALAAWRPMLTAALPALTDVKFQGQVSIPTDMASVRVADAKLTVQGGDLAGAGLVEFDSKSGGVQALHATLASSQLDLDALLRTLGIDLWAAPGGGQASGDMPMPWTTTGGPEMDVTATIDAATLLHHDWHGVGLALRRDAKSQAATMRVAMPDGPVQVSVSADTSAHFPAKVSVHAPGIPLALAGQYLGLPGPISGAARVEAELHGAGRTVRDFVASLSGSASVTAVGGRLSNAAFAKLTGGSLQPLGIKVPAQGETALRCLGLIGTAQDGVVRLQTIALASTYLSLSGAGQIDLGRETVALKLHPLVPVAGSPVAVPVVVDGPFGAINARLDASGLDKVGLLIDGLFGGDAPKTCSDAGLTPASADEPNGPS